MATFAEYGFNKSHSTAYSMISYQTAYLKAHYPVEFMAALLTSEKNNRDNIIKYISSCKEMGIEVLPPDINDSFRDFSVSGGSIRFGLAAVKNVGVGAVDSIIEARGKGDKFSSFYNFCSRVDLRRVNKKVLESLIKCGAFDSLEKNRRRLMEGFERLVDVAQKRSRDLASGQFSLFGTEEISDEPGFELPDVAEWGQDQILANEKDTLGFYITGHPLLQFGDRLQLVTDGDSEKISGKGDGATVAVAGIVSNIRNVTTKRKDTMAYVTLEDMKGSLVCIVFADLYRDAFSLINSDEPLLVKGKVDAGEESPKIIATEIVPLGEAMKNPFSSVHFMINADAAKAIDIDLLKDLLSKYRGKNRGYVHLCADNGTETVISLGNGCTLAISDDVRSEVDRLFGEGTTKFR
jgi:DNA polymerase-3 subunit alpha